MPNKEERKLKREQKIQEIKMAEKEDTFKLEKGEKVFDVKGTLEALIEEEKPEIPQEEAINMYKEEDIISKQKNSNNTEDEEEAEDEEHLKRVKQELLESLERVNKLAKILFSEKENSSKEKSKVKDKEKNREKSREKTIEDRTKGGIERTRE